MTVRRRVIVIIGGGVLFVPLLLWLLAPTIGRKLVWPSALERASAGLGLTVSGDLADLDVAGGILSAGSIQLGEPTSPICAQLADFEARFEPGSILSSRIHLSRVELRGLELSVDLDRSREIAALAERLRGRGGGDGPRLDRLDLSGSALRVTWRGRELPIRDVSRRRTGSRS